MSRQVPVDIRLNSTIERADMPAEKTELHTQGRLYEKAGSFYLLYKEEVKDLGAVKHTIKVKESEALILRKGQISMRQPMKVGVSSEGTYGSPMGSMQTLVDAKRCQVEWSPDLGRGRIDLIYRMYLQGQDVGNVTLTFKLEEQHH